MRVIATTAVVLASLSIGRADPKPDPKPRVIATMSRHPCFGTCPVYTLTIRADGTVEYLGQHHVQTKGARTATLTKDQLDRLAKLFATAGFLDLPKQMVCGAEDVPYVDTSYDDGKRSNKVNHDPTCSMNDGKRTEKLREPSQKLAVLENAIDDLVDVRQWIGPQGKTYAW